VTKRYYWLKLHRDFFKRHDTRIIEAMENGEKYLLFYLKLLVESIDHEGDLRFSDTIPYNDSMLATITNTDIDIVRSAVKVFTELNMMQQFDDGTLFMAQVATMIGDETDWARKKRDYRERTKDEKRTLEDNVRQELEIDLDIELEKDQEKNARAMEKHITAEPDEVLTVYRKGIEALGLPTTAWPEPGNQHIALKDITARTKLLAPDSALPDPVEFARGILAVFKRRKETGKGGYWKDASPAPKVLLRRFDELVVGLGDEFERAETEREGMDALRRMGKI